MEEYRREKQWSLISIRGSSNVTIIGGGTLQAKKDDSYAIDVFDEDSKCTIENGTFVGNVHAVYVLKGSLVVNGGTFSVQQKYNDTFPYEYVLNCYDAHYKDGTASIIVNGGSFAGFNPRDCRAEGAGTNFCASGIKVTESKDENITIYTVAKLENGQMVVNPVLSEDGSVSASLEGTFEADATIDVEDGTNDGIDGGSGVDGNDITVVLSTSGSSTTATTLNITQTTATSLSDANSLTVNTDVGTISLDSAALDKIAQSAETESNDAAVVVTVTKNNTQSDATVLASYTVEVKIGDRNVLPYSGSDNGMVTITVPLPDESKAASDYKVWYVTRDSGNTIHYVNELNKVDAETGYIAYQIGHLSETVLTANTAEITTDEAIVTDSDGDTKGSYSTLAEAVTAADNGDTVTLLKNVVVTAPTDVNTGAINISKNITIDGTDAKYSISAAAEGFTMYKPWSSSDTITGQYHLINISGDGSANQPNVTLKNLTLNGGWDGDAVDGQMSESTFTGSAAKSGINVWNAGKVILDNITVNDCSVYGVVANGSTTEVTVTDLTTSGNRWGVNVDNGGRFTMESGTLNEAASLVIEGDESETTTVTVEAGTFNGAVQVSAAGNPLTVKGGTFSNSVADYVDESIKYEVNSGSGRTPYSYYTNIDAALTAAGSTGTIKVVNSSAAETHTVTFDYNYSGRDDYTVPVVDGDEITLPSPNRSGYTFRHWSDGSETYSAGMKVTINDDITFTAVWRSNSSSSGSSSGGGSSSSSNRYTVSVDSGIDNGSVSVSPSRAERGDTVTITIDPDEGYELDRLTVRDSRGNRIDVERQSDTRYTFEMPSGRVTVDATFTEVAETPETPDQIGSFTDVDTDDWFADAVQYMLDNGMMNGVTDTTFGPGTTTTRGMIVTILYRLEGEPDTTASSFTDVASGMYYADAVAWAKANSIVTGITETIFAPDQAITREQMAAILYRYAQYKGYDVTASNDLSSYTDASRISAYATTAMQWANAEGLITGNTSTTINPTGNATRAEVATILMRFCETVTK